MKSWRVEVNEKTGICGILEFFISTKGGGIIGLLGISRIFGISWEVEG